MVGVVKGRLQGLSIFLADLQHSNVVGTLVDRITQHPMIVDGLAHIPMPTLDAALLGLQRNFKDCEGHSLAGPILEDLFDDL